MYQRRFAVYGALFGCFFPVGATLLQAAFEASAHGFGRGLARAQAMPLMWIIDTAPFFLGLFASFAGRRQDQLLVAEAAKRTVFVETARELLAAAKELLSTVSSFSAVNTETAASVRETTATMTQLSHTAAQAALTAETVVGLADSTQRCSTDGLRAVQTATAEMVDLGEVVRGLSARIKGLAERGREVIEVASVVTYVADESQRLAAAVAGEVQRNPAAAVFGGVAARMRRHADEAKKAAIQVKKILGEVDEAMLQAVSAAEHGAVRADQGAAVARATGETIQRLAAALHDSSQAARDIAQVAQQQDHGIDLVLAAMNEIFRATEDGMAGTQRVAAGARTLNDLALRLQRSVGASP